MKRLIFSSPHAYHASSRVGAHHLATALAARGWRVLFLTHAVTPLHVLAAATGGTSAAERLRELRLSGPKSEPDDGVERLTPLTLAPLGGRGLAWRWVLRRWPDYTIPNLERRLSAAGFARPDVFVADGPIGWPLATRLDPAVKVLRVLDRPEGFSGGTPAVIEALSTAACEADLSVATTPGLCDYLRECGAPTPRFLGPGVAFEAFQGTPEPPAAYDGIPAPRAIYVGATGPWVDLRLLAETARRTPEVSFVVIGPVDGRVRTELGGLANIHLLGTRPWSEIPAYLAHAQCGIIPFDAVKHATLVDDVNPIKLYEYLAAGLPTVSVRWSALERLGSPAVLVDGADEMAAAVRRQIDAPVSSEVLRAFARRFDWAAVAARFEEMVREASLR